MGGNISRCGCSTETDTDGSARIALYRPDPLEYRRSREPRRRESRRSSAVEQLIRNQQVIGSNPIVGSRSDPPASPKNQARTVATGSKV